MKKQLGIYLSKQLENNQVIGVGTGSTVNAVLDVLGKKASDDALHISVLTTSFQSAIKCADYGFKVLDPVGYSGGIDWGFDGADEVDPSCRLIKGKGGAMLLEKVLASRCRDFIIVIDEGKTVSKLGSRMPVPVEVIPESLHSVQRYLRELGATQIILRDGLPGKHGPVITEKGNLILDCSFKTIPDSLEKSINTIVGVVENGIFTDFATKVLVAHENGIKEINP